VISTSGAASRPSKSSYVRRSVGQSVLVSGHHLRPLPNFSSSQWKISSGICVCVHQYEEPYLARGRVCNILVLLGLASAVALGSKSHRTEDHMLLPQLRLGSLSAASCVSQRYGGGILPRLHGRGEFKSNVQVKVILRPTVSRPVCPDIGPPCETSDQHPFLSTADTATIRDTLLFAQSPLYLLL
jgi:hypothetical protein